MDGCFIEWLDAKAEVIEVSTVLRWRRTAGLAELTIHWHEVDQGAPRTKLNQPDGILASLDRAAEHSAVEAKHAIEVDDSQHKVINLANVNHGRGMRGQRGANRRARTTHANWCDACRASELSAGLAILFWLSGKKALFVLFNGIGELGFQFNMVREVMDIHMNIEVNSCCCPWL
jgi:hypothetical protein